jgi:hypothetical protein
MELVMAGVRVTELEGETGGMGGDSRPLATARIQQAIDRCHAEGGGVVALRRGLFVTGSLHLRSGVNLHVDASATLLGSPNLADYYVDPEQDYAGHIIGPVLIFTKACSQVAVTGPGAIDGNGACFEKRMNVPRPVLIRFRNCTGVRVSGLRLCDGGSWTVHTVGCTHVRLEHLTIRSLLHLTTDGLDIDGCQDVFVHGCSIDTGDDAIAIKAAQRDRPCRDVIISDCRLSSHCQAIRVGPETLSDIERVVASDCIISDTGMGGICVQAAHGGTVRDLVFRGMIMDRVSNPISVRLGGWQEGDANSAAWVLDDSRWQAGAIRDVLFSDIRARVPRRFMEGTAKESSTFLNNERTAITITGTWTTRPARIVLDQVDITFPGGGTAAEAARRIPELDRRYPTPYMFGVPPAYGLFARHVDGLDLRNVRFRLASPDARPAVVCDDVSDFDRSGLRADASQTVDTSHGAPKETVP